MEHQPSKMFYSKGYVEPPKMISALPRLLTSCYRIQMGVHNKGSLLSFSIQIPNPIIITRYSHRAIMNEMIAHMIAKNQIQSIHVPMIASMKF